MRKRTWLVIAVIVLVVGIGYTGYILFAHGGDDSLTVSELKLQAESIDGQRVSVRGQVVPGSISWDEKAQVITFALTDDKSSLDIAYKGIVPDNFKPRAELVVEGEYRIDGIFEAQSFSRPRSLCILCH